MLVREQLEQYQNEIRNQEPEAVLRWVLEKVDKKQVGLASSFSIEDQVLTHMLVGIEPQARIFTLDTGRLFQETYDVIDKTMMTYGIAIEILCPDKGEVEELVKEKGPNLFYNSVEDRKRCCEIRKVHSLQKVLSTLQVWITGLRREQSVTRTGLEKIEWDEGNGLFKLNPLADWSEQQVKDYIQKYKIPYNILHDRGYPSIGCLPCTRPVKEGEDIRSGRWWWENPEHKECGLHVKK